MDDLFDIPKLLKLRKVTNTISTYLEQELKSNISTLSPLFHPKLVFGEHISGCKQAVKGSDASFKQLQEAYKSLQQSKTFYNKLNGLTSPIDLFGSSLELTPYKYTYKTTTNDNSKTIQITSPLKWILSFKNQGSTQLRELLAEQANPRKTNIQICLLHHLALHSICTKQQNIANLLGALHFPVNIEPSAEFGNLPLVYISSSVTTTLPPDDIIIQSTELSGMPVFEEIIDLDAIEQLADPFKEKMLELS
jgi:hypothetical protein